MPASHRALTRAGAADIARAVFRPSPAPLCGIELEWPVHSRNEVTRRPTHAELLDATPLRLPSGSRVSIEPGGQVELSTQPYARIDEVLDAATADTAVLHAHLRRAGLRTADQAIDLDREPQRILPTSRYACMESFFGTRGTAGAWMMCNTASLQVNVAHDPADPNRRWTLAHRLGPVLLAAFANSPGVDAAGRRWESLRQGIWWSIDPGRTHPPEAGPAPEAWLDYALAADVMLMRCTEGSAAIPVPPGLPFGRWLEDGHCRGWPTAGDLQYHLTTLFPPIRPRGWLELRMLDLLPAGLRDVATVVVLTALTTEAGRELGDLLPPTDGLWCAAARHGLAHPALGDAARLVFDHVLPAVSSVTSDPQRLAAVHTFADRHVRPGLSPAQLTPDADLVAAFAPRLDAGSTVDSPRQADAEN